MQRATLRGGHPMRFPATTPSRRPAPPPEPGITAHGMEYPALFGQFGSAHPAVYPPGFW